MSALFALSLALRLFGLPRTIFPPLLLVGFLPRAKPDIFLNDNRVEKKAPLSLLLSSVEQKTSHVPQLFSLRAYLPGRWDGRKRLFQVPAGPPYHHPGDLGC